MSYLICFERYELQVEVTRCLVVPPNSNTWDSDWDFYGYQELEFEVVSGIAYDEDGENPKEIDGFMCDMLTEQYGDLIADKLWAQLETEGKEYDE